MDFTSENFTKLLPDFLPSTEKNRLKTQLAQFSKWNRKDNDNLKVNKSDSEINYDLFYPFHALNLSRIAFTGTRSSADIDY